MTVRGCTDGPRRRSRGEIYASARTSPASSRLRSGVGEQRVLRQVPVRVGPRAAPRPSPRRSCRSCPRAPRRSPGSSSAACRSPPCCRRSPASPRCSCARRRRPTAPASSPRAATSTGRRLTVVEDVVTSGGQVDHVVRRPARARRDRRAGASASSTASREAPTVSPTSASSSAPLFTMTELDAPPRPEPPDRFSAGSPRLLRRNPH